MSNDLRTESRIEPSQKRSDSDAAVSLIQPVAPGKPLRDALGRILPGQKMPGAGRPKVSALVQIAARAEGLKCVQKLIQLRDEGKSEKIQLAATQALLDRGFGRPREMKEEEDAPTYQDVELDQDTVAALMGAK